MVFEILYYNDNFNTAIQLDKAIFTTNYRKSSLEKFEMYFLNHSIISHFLISQPLKIFLLKAFLANMSNCLLISQFQFLSVNQDQLSFTCIVPSKETESSKVLALIF